MSASEPSVADVLRSLPLLAGLSDEQHARLAAGASMVHLRAGSWLFRQGEPAETAYVVCSGRLEVVAERPHPGVISTLKRGALLGELALLHDGGRSASVRARRDSALLEVGREQLEALIGDAPAFAMTLLRALAGQVAANVTPTPRPDPPRTIAVVGLDPAAPAPQVAAGLERELARHGRLARLDPGPARRAADLAAQLDRAEHDAERVLLVAGAAEPSGAWPAFCRHEADVLVAVTSGEPAPAWRGHAAALDGCELLVTGRRTAPDGFVARNVQVVREPGALDARVAATARRLAGRSVGVVLSGGGARAMAHIGAVEALLEAGIVIDRIAGASMGALVAATFALGDDAQTVRDRFHANFVATNPSNDYALPVYSLLRGGKARRLLHGAFGDRRIEELARQYFCVSCDLLAKELVVHRTGPVAEAIYPSLAIPGVFPPVAYEGRLLVDGGVLDNLPVETMWRTAEGPIVAIDVSGRPAPPRESPRARAARIGRPVRRVLAGSSEPVPRLGDTLLRTLTLGSRDTTAAARRHADLTIEPRIEGVGMLEWQRLDTMRALGRDAARAALVDAPAELRT